MIIAITNISALGATSYDIYKDDVYHGTSNGSSYYIYDVPVGTYDIKVIAKNGNYESCSFDVKTIVIVEAAPSAVSNLVAANVSGRLPGNGAVDLTWSKPNGNGIISYKLEYKLHSSTTWNLVSDNITPGALQNTLNYRHEGSFDNNVNLDYRVSAYNGRYGVSSNVANVTVLTPTNNNSTIALSTPNKTSSSTWTVVATTSPAPDSIGLEYLYYITVSEGSATLDFSPNYISSGGGRYYLGKSPTTITVTVPNNGTAKLRLTSVGYTVSAIDKYVESSLMSNIPVPIFNGTYPSVTPLSGTAGSTTFTCTTGGWDNSPTSYKYQWEWWRVPYMDWYPIPGEQSNTFSPASNFNSSYPNGGVRCSVIATNSGGDSSPVNSNTITVNSPGSVPSGGSVSLAGSGQSGTSISASTSTLGWTNASSYLVWITSANGVTPNENDTIVASSSTVSGGSVTASYTVTSSDVSLMKKFRAFAKATNTNGSTTVSSSEILTASSAGSAPSAPTGLSATTNRTDYVELSGYTVSGSNITYEFYRSSSQNSTPNTVIFSTTNSTYNDVISSGLNQYYWVRATNSNGSSNWYPSGNGILGFVNTVNNAPYLISCGDISGTPTVGQTVSLSSNGSWGNNPTSYSYSWEVYDTTIAEWVPLSSNSSFIIPSGYGGYQIHCVITASNSGGSYSCTTAPKFISGSSAGSAPSAPTGLSATTNRTDGVNLTWNASPQATSYGIWYGAAPSSNSTPDFTTSNTSYLDTSSLVGVSRDYYVRASNSYGNSNWTGPATGIKISSTPPPPNNLSTPSITNVTKSGSDYTVDISGGSGSPYQVWWQTSSSSPSNCGPGDSQTNTSSATVSNLSATQGATYYFFARSVSSTSVTDCGPSTTASSWSSGYSYTEPIPSFTPPHFPPFFPPHFPPFFPPHFPPHFPPFFPPHFPPFFPPHFPPHFPPFFPPHFPPFFPPHFPPVASCSSSGLVYNYGSNVDCPSGCTMLSSGSGTGYGNYINTPCGSFYGIYLAPYQWKCCGDSNIGGGGGGGQQVL